MIENKEDLKYYLNQDRIALREKRKTPRIFYDDIWKYQIILRKAEYYTNIGKKIRSKFYKFKLKKKSIKLGIFIPINVFDSGLSIAHIGNIIVNGNAKIGKNCRIQEMVNIGSTGGSNRAPKLGNNIFIGTGAKIIGDISIADGVAIGANAVVVKNIEEPFTTWGGIPAKKISNNGSKNFLDCRLFK